jgi:hypothetical protein
MQAKKVLEGDGVERPLDAPLLVSRVEDPLALEPRE